MASAPPPLEEPKTPMWLPALGAALFLGAGIWYAMQPSEPPPHVDSADASEAGAPEGGADAATAVQPQAR